MVYFFLRKCKGPFLFGFVDYYIGFVRCLIWLGWRFGSVDRTMYGGRKKTAFPFST